MSILKIDSSARLADSNSRQLTHYLTQQLIIERSQPLVERDLAQAPLPAISSEDLIDLHASRDEARTSLQQQRALSDQLIAELQAAETLIIGLPIYNFSVPASLKQWIDHICRAGHTFRYGANGPEGLLNIQRAFIVTAAGGVALGSDMDFASGYMEHICRFIGVKEVIQIDASGSKRNPELIIEQGREQIDRALESIYSPSITAESA